MNMTEKERLSEAQEEEEQEGVPAHVECDVKLIPAQILYSSITSISTSAMLTSRMSLGKRSNLGASTHNLVLQQADVYDPKPSTSLEGKEQWMYTSPPDMGYSWVVLASCALIQICFAILAGSSGIFLTEFIEVFHRDKITTSWVCTLQQSMIFVMSPFAGLMVDKFGGRITVMVGSVGTGLSMGAASFTSSFEVLLLTYGILTGSFSSFVLIPTTVCVGEYFLKHKILALTAVSCCLPLTFAVSGPVATLLIEMYDWRVANLCFAAIILQNTALGALLRPQKLKKGWREVSTEESVDMCNSTTSVYGRLRKYSFSHHVKSHNSLFEEDSSAAAADFIKPVIDSSNINLCKQTSAQHESQAHHQSEVAFEVIPEDLALEVIPEDLALEIIPADLPLEVIPEDLPLEVNPESLPLQVTEKNQRLMNREECETFHENYLPASEYECIIYRCSAKLQHMGKRAISHWRLALLLAYNFTWGWGASTFFVLLPEYAKSNSVGFRQISQLFIIIGLSGFSGRFSTVVFCRVYPKFNKASGFLVALLAQSGALFGLSMTDKFAGIAAMTALYSFSYGWGTCLTTPTILEIHGDQHLAVVYGLLMLFYGTGMTLSAPLAALLYQNFGSYSIGFQCSAAVAFIGCLIFLPYYIVLCWKKSNSKKEIA